ncbi:hypothetical protein ACFWG0_37605 [Streptomyces yangpuensis]|uniref:hypothetical protein n=1 Tax=Streptomyces yangpuensis TaxID=1648182 RepID=UPI00365598A3
MAAARMQQLGEHHGTDTVAQHLDRLTTNTTSWQEATGPALVGRLVDATLTSLTTPPGTPAASRPRVSAAAARSRSITTPAAAAPGRPAPAEAAVPAHRQQAAPARGAGRTVTAKTPGRRALRARGSGCGRPGGRCRAGTGSRSKVFC